MDRLDIWQNARSAAYAIYVGRVRAHVEMFEWGYTSVADLLAGIRAADAEREASFQTAHERFQAAE